MFHFYIHSGVKRIWKNPSGSVRSSVHSRPSKMCHACDSWCIGDDNKTTAEDWTLYSQTPNIPFKVFRFVFAYFVGIFKIFLVGQMEKSHDKVLHQFPASRSWACVACAHFVNKTLSFHSFIHQFYRHSFQSPTWSTWLKTNSRVQTLFLVSTEG